MRRTELEVGSGRTTDYISDVTVEAIKEAISPLPDDERHSLAVWLNEFDYDDWDQKMVAVEFPSGTRLS